MFFSIWQHCQIMKDHSNVTNMHFWMIQRDKREGFGHFLDLGQFNRLGIAYYDRTKCFPTFGNSTRSWRIIQKSQKCLFEWSKVPKKDIFGRFMDLGLLDLLDIAYYDGSKCFSTFGTVRRSWKMILKSQKCIFERPTEAKKKFMAIFSSLGCWIDLLSHILMVLNSFYHWYCYQVMKVHKKITEMHDSKSKKVGFWPFFAVWVVESTSYCICISSG